MSENYEIRVKGHLDSRWSTWFDGLHITTEDGGTTVIHGPVADQSALHGVLQKVRDTGLTLISITSPSHDPRRPDMTTTLPRSTVPTDSSRRLAFAAGALYILTFFTSIPTLALYSSVLHDPSWVTGPGSDTAVQLGAMLEMICALTGIGTAIALHPVVARQNAALALGFVASRTVEGCLIALGVVSLLSVVGLHQNPAGMSPDSLTAASAALVGVYKGTFLLGQSLMPVVNALLLGSLLYRSRLVPRWIPTLGLVGAPLLFVSVTAAVFGLHEQVSALGGIATLPIALWEASVGVYLLVKGFRPVPGLTSPVEAAH